MQLGSTPSRCSLITLSRREVSKGLTELCFLHSLTLLDLVLSKYFWSHPYDALNRWRLAVAEKFKPAAKSFIYLSRKYNSFNCRTSPVIFNNEASISAYACHFSNISSIKDELWWYLSTMRFFDAFDLNWDMIISFSSTTFAIVFREILKYFAMASWDLSPLETTFKISAFVQWPSNSLGWGLSH